VWRHLSVGAQASYFVQPPIGSVPDISDYTAHVGASGRIFIEGHAESDFAGELYDGPSYWWIAWGVGVLGVLAVNVFAGGDDGDENRHLGAIEVGR
jgi:hypothetical protein